MNALPKVSPEKQRKRQEFSAATAGPAPEVPVKLPAAGVQHFDLGQKSGQAGGGPGGGQEQQEGGPAQVMPIPPTMAKRLQQSFGHDFSDVTIRTGGAADAECEKRGAVAFAVGRTITFSKDAYNPASAEFYQVLAHEAAHVVQQAGGGSAATKKQVEQGDAKKDKLTAKKGAGGGNTEGEADAAASAAAADKPVAIEQQAPSGAPQDKKVNPNQFMIPLPGGHNISFTPPNNKGDYSLSVKVGKKIFKGVKEKKSKFWRKNIPTPFFGLNLQLGAQLGVEFKVGELSVDAVKISYTKSKDQYKLELGAKTGMSLELFGALTAGVAVDAWIAEAGVGLKAKLALTKSHPLSASLFGTYSPSTGAWSMGGKFSLKALELALKAAVGLFVYYDAWGVSTYTKDWWLYQRTLGKMSFGGVDFIAQFGSGGFSGKVVPKPFELQDLAGNIKGLYPSKSK